MRTKNPKTSRSALAGLAPPLPLSHHQQAARPHPHQAPPRHAFASILPRLRGACAHAELVAFTATKARVLLRVFTRRRRGRCTCVARASRPCLSRARLQICGASRSLWSFLRAKRRTRQTTLYGTLFFGIWPFCLSRPSNNYTTRHRRQQSFLLFIWDCGSVCLSSFPFISRIVSFLHH